MATPREALRVKTGFRYLLSMREIVSPKRATDETCRQAVDVQKHMEQPARNGKLEVVIVQNVGP